MYQHALVMSSHCTSFTFIAHRLPVHTARQQRQPRWTCRKARNKAAAGTKSNARSRAAKRSEFYDAMKLYRDHFQPLLDAELKAEEQAVMEQRSEASVGGNASYVLNDLVVVGKSRLFSFNVYSLRPRSGRGGLAASNEFRNGDLVQLGKSSEPDSCSVEGAVLKKTLHELFVTVPIGSTAVIEMDLFMEQRTALRVQCGTNTLAYERATFALAAMTKVGPDATDLSKLLVMSFAAMCKSKMDAVTEEKAVSVGNDTDILKNPFSDPSEDAMTSKWNSFAKEKVAKLDENDLARTVKALPTFLNPSQRSAIRTALRQRLTLIQGPPGTGKTVTTAYIIACAVKLGLGPVLACAASNVAADNLLRKVIEVSPKSCRVVRFGRVAAIDEDLWRYSLEKELERDPALRKAREVCANGSMKFAQLQEIETKATKAVLRRANVCISTCVLSGRDELKEMWFPFVVIDEATQATEPDVLIPLSVNIEDKVQRQLVLVGDHHQLPPTVLSLSKGNLAECGLETSLFLRLWTSGIECRLLDVQYRMHPQIACFPSLHFYFKRLKNGITENDRRLPGLRNEGDWSLLNSPTVFVNLSHGKEEKDPNLSDGIGRGRSYFNEVEAQVILKYVAKLLSSEAEDDKAEGFVTADIGVISPYAGQVRLLRQMLRQEGRSQVEVNTVDGFQGREKNVIMVSAVRSNEKGQVGFLSDWRRLNVAITRARLALVVVGNEETLKQDQHWNAWIKWLRRNGQYVDEVDHSR